MMVVVEEFVLFVKNKNGRSIMIHTLVFSMVLLENGIRIYLERVRDDGSL